jgi:hypothetical protein
MVKHHTLQLHPHQAIYVGQQMFNRNSEKKYVWSGLARAEMLTGKCTPIPTVFGINRQRDGLQNEKTMITVYWILWPAFMVAALATGLLIFAVNPQDIQLAGHPITISNISAYSLGFFTLWFVSCASSLVTHILQCDEAK